MGIHGGYTGVHDDELCWVIMWVHGYGYVVEKEPHIEKKNN